MWATSAHADRATAKQLFEQGMAAEQAGEIDAALTLYQQAIREDTDYAPAYERATPLWMRKGSFRTAILALERFSLRHPKQAFAWYALAYAYRRTGQPDYAALSYESYIALRPQDATPYFGLGMVRLDVGDESGARAAFAAYVRMERNPERAAFVEQARHELALLGGGAIGSEDAQSGRVPARSQGVRDGSNQTLKSVRDEQAESGLRAVALLAAEGRHDEALAKAATVQAREPRERLRLAIWRAHLLTATGRTDEARTVLWGVLAAAPTHVAAYRMLAELPESDIRL